MSEPLVVEVWGKAAGFVLKEGKAFRFHALGRPFAELDGTEFNTLGHARLAAAALQPPKSAPYADCRAGC
jgi:hypothetical protein